MFLSSYLAILTFAAIIIISKKHLMSLLHEKMKPMLNIIWHIADRVKLHVHKIEPETALKCCHLSSCMNELTKGLLHKSKLTKCLGLTFLERLTFVRQ